jgi:hypothetical protein
MSFKNESCTFTGKSRFSPSGTTETIEIAISIASINSTTSRPTSGRNNQSRPTSGRNNQSRPTSGRNNQSRPTSGRNNQSRPTSGHNTSRPLQNCTRFGAVFVLFLIAFSGTATAQPIPVPQLVRQVVEPIEPYLGPVYDGVNGAANLILNEVPHLTLEPFPLNHVHIDDGGVGEFLQGIDFFDHVDEISNLEPFPLNHIHSDDGGLGEFLQGVDFVDEVDDVMNVAGDAFDDMYLLSSEEAEDMVVNMFDDIAVDHGANVAADLADDAINAADLVDDVVNGAGAAATGVAQGLMDNIPWTDISPQNIIGELGEKCLRTKCYHPVVTPPVPVPVPLPTVPKPLTPIIAPLAGAFSGYMKTKETGSVKAGVAKGTVVTGTSYLISTYLAPICIGDPEPASKVVCFGMLAGFSYLGSSVGDAVADSFVEPNP